MTIKINQFDKIYCYFCNEAEDDNPDWVFESVTLSEVAEVGNGTYTVFICPKCRKNKLGQAVGKSFVKRYIKANGESWSTEESE